MSLLYLSPELLLMIGNSIEAERDLNSLCQTSRKFYDLLNPYLYRTNTKSPKKSSALIWAAIKGSEATARMSLQQGGDVQWIDDEGRNLVSLAAQNGHDMVVKLFLKTGQVDINMVDCDDYRNPRSSLSYAAEAGHETIVELLLEHENVDVDQGCGIRSPLSYAAAGGHAAVVKLLLKTGHANMDMVDHTYRAPFSYAAEGGHETVMKL